KFPALNLGEHICVCLCHLSHPWHDVQQVLWQSVVRFCKQKRCFPGLEEYHVLVRDLSFSDSLQSINKDWVRLSQTQSQSEMLGEDSPIPHFRCVLRSHGG